MLTVLLQNEFFLSGPSVHLAHLLSPIWVRSNSALSMAHEKLQAITHWPTPKTEAIKRFFGSDWLLQKVYPRLWVNSSSFDISAIQKWKH